MANQLFTDVMIFDGTGKKSFPGEVLVQGNQIKAVAKGNQKIAGDGATVIDGGGATLMPGLVNCHGHLAYTDFASPDEAGNTPPEENMLIATYNARTALDHGFTAVVSGSTQKPRIDIALRNEINAGRIPGPRMRACSTQFNPTGGPWDSRQMHMDHESIFVIADGPIEVRRKVREFIREGVDIVKLTISGDEFAEHAGEETTVMAEDEVAAAAEVVHSRGKRMAAHARSDGSVRLCLKYGVTFIYHATFATERTLDLLEKHKADHVVCPAMGAIFTTLYEAGEWGMTREWALAHRFDRELETACEVTQKLFKRGVHVLPFGDYGFAWNPHGTDARDLEHFVNLMGFTPAQVLTMATNWGGQAFAGDDPLALGQVKAGYLADLLLVDGDPLADVTLLQDKDNLLMVMKDGEYHRAPLKRRTQRRVRAAE